MTFEELKKECKNDEAVYKVVCELEQQCLEQIKQMFIKEADRRRKNDGR